MSIKSSFALFLGKSSRFVLHNFLHRGSTLPGKIALKFDADFLSALNNNYEIIVVTGTNGKTLTAALTTALLREAGYEVLTNPTGANMITGIASTLLSAKKPTKKTGKKRFAVLEIDEASLPEITKTIKPNLFVFTNIFRDQMDRYGEIYTTYNFILKGAEQSPEATVLLNGDSPIFSSKKLVNPVKYYGFKTQDHEPSRVHYNTEGVLCPQCHHILDYRENTYANLGNFICQNCGFHRPELDTALTEISNQTTTTSSFVVDGQSYDINVGGVYNVYNALAAIAVAEHYNIPSQVIKAGLDHSKAVFGRQETLKIGKKDVTIILIKNPVGASQTIELLKLNDSNFNLVALLNANYADGIDTSWIWDANFEDLAKLPIDQVITGGVRANEISRRLRVAGLENIQEQESLSAVLESVKTLDDKPVYILATYTAMLEIRETLAKAGYLNKEMA